MADLKPLELARLLESAARDKKGYKPIRVYLRGKTSIADYFVITEGETDRQVKAIADAMVETAREHGVRPLAVQGYEDGNWVLIDFDAVVAHVFLPGERAFYDLESLWSAAARRRETT